MKWYDQLVDHVIRPPRTTYDEKTDLVGGHLGRFKLGGRTFRRDDFEVTNPQGTKLKCSHYVPESFNPESAASRSLPCVIYAHGNCGCRLEACDSVYCLLPSNISVCALDFSGSGLSGGEYVTLGKIEAQDLEAVCEYLRENRGVDRLGLWGRSMGAVASIFFSKKNPIVAGMVLDSAFSNLVTLMLELVDDFAPKLPKIVAMGALGMFRRSIRRRSGMDIHDMKPENAVESCFVPALFAHGKDDSFVKIDHTEKLYTAYAGDKRIIRFEGEHNSLRPDDVLEKIANFFVQVLNPPSPENDPRELDRLMSGNFNAEILSLRREISGGDFEIDPVSEENSDDDQLQIALQLSLESKLEGDREATSQAERDPEPV